VHAHERHGRGACACHGARNHRQDGFGVRQGGNSVVHHQGSGSVITLTIPVWLAHVMFWAFVVACVSVAWRCPTTGAFALWLWASEVSAHKAFSEWEKSSDK